MRFNQLALPQDSLPMSSPGIHRYRFDDIREAQLVDDFMPQPLNSEELNTDENIIVNDHHNNIDFRDIDDPILSDADLDDQNVVANDYRIKLGDIIKFGRISYKVTQLYLPEAEQKTKNF